MKLEDIAKQLLEIEEAIFKNYHADDRRELIAKLHTIVKELQQKAKIVKYAETELNNLSQQLQELK